MVLFRLARYSKLSVILAFAILLSTLLPAKAETFPERIEASAEVYDGEIVISWIDPDNDDFDKIKVVGAGKTVYIDKGVQKASFTGLINGILYTFRLYAVSKSGILYAETQISATPADKTPPMPVSNAMAEVSGDRIILTWSDPSDSDLDRIRISLFDKDYYIDAGVQKLIVYNIEYFKEYKFDIVAIDTSNNMSENVTVTAFPVAEAKISLNGPATVTSEEVFNVDLSLSTVRSDVFSVSASVYYDLDKFAFTGYEEIAENIILTAVYEAVYGRIDVYIAANPAITGYHSPLIDLIFTANKVDETSSGIIYVDRASVGIAPSGEIVQAEGDIHCVTILKPTDNVPPGEINDLSIEEGHETLKLTWKDPEDSDLKGIIITVDNSVSYEVGKGIEELTISDLLNGKEVKIVIQTIDVSGNISKGITVYAVPGIPGDMNNDGIVNIGDLSLVMSWYGVKQGEPNWEKAQKYDVSGANQEPDGIIDIYDLVYIAAKILGA